jgi:hypothetical protein
MSDQVDLAKEGIEHAHHASHEDAGARRVAVMIAALAAALAVSEMGEKAAQNAYLTHHIQASDDWAFYQAKTVRMNMYALHADLLEQLPPTEAARKRIEAAQATASRLDDDPNTDGRKQVQAKARESEAARDHAFHRYHLFEAVVGALQIAIVLASVSVVTRVRWLSLAAGGLGIAAGLSGLAVALELI